MDNKKKTHLIIGGIVAVVLVSVVLVGLINGVWPWQTGKDFGDGYIGSNLSGDKETTDPTNETTEPETTNKEEENKGPEDTEPNKPSGSGSDSENGNNNDIDVEIDIGDGSGQGNNQDNGQGDNQQGGNQGDGNQGDGEETPSGKPNVGGTVIDFDDLLNMSGK